MSKENELKPCPFCGGEAEIKRALGESPRIRNVSFETYYLEAAYYIRCKRCRFNVPEFTISLEIDVENLSLKTTLEKEAQYWVARWNRRAGDEQREAD